MSDLILSALAAGPLTLAQICDQTGLTVPKARKALAELRACQQAHKIGDKRGAKYGIGPAA